MNPPSLGHLPRVAKGLWLARVPQASMGRPRPLRDLRHSDTHPRADCREEKHSSLVPRTILGVSGSIWTRHRIPPCMELGLEPAQAWPGPLHCSPLREGAPHTAELRMCPQLCGRPEVRCGVRGTVILLETLGSLPEPPVPVPQRAQRPLSWTLLPLAPPGPTSHLPSSGASTWSHPPGPRVLQDEGLTGAAHDELRPLSWGPPMCAPPLSALTGLP